MTDLKEYEATESLVSEGVRATDFRVNYPGQERGVDLKRIETAVREILYAIGEDPDRDGLLETPKRVAKAYRELFKGLTETATEHLSRTFEQAHDDAVIVRDIDYFSVCEHHLLPFMGKAHVAYLPSNGRVVGLSKIARTVEVYARRPQVQERLTNQIADALVRSLKPRGVMVVLDGEHLCMKMRGVNKPGSRMITTAYRGVLREDRAMAGEVMRLMTSPS